jgi:CubicO group peptidase (beta-lactamase class C family)
VDASALVIHAVLALTAPVSAFTQTPAAPDPNARAVDRLFDTWRGTETPGCAVGVSRHGRRLLERGYGMANLETGTPIQPGTIFHAASIAKQFTAMAVMLLVRDGKVSLDDDIRRFIPELPDYGTAITVRHLLTHTSGLRDFFEMLILARGRFEEDRITDADMMDMITRQRVLNYSPGAEYLYSNSGYALLKVLVQRVSGQSLRDLAADRIFAPLGMSHTLFHDDYTALVPGRASGYAPLPTGWRSSSPNYDVYGPTSLLTTVGDLLLWAANFDGPRVGDTSIVRQMSTSAVLLDGDSTHYGFGLSLANDRGARVQEHEGSDPGFRVYLGRYPEYGLAIAVLCNTRSANAVALGHDIAGIYLDTMLKAAPPYPLAGPRAADSLVAASRAGVYFHPVEKEVVELSWRDGALYTARRGGAKLIPLADGRLQIEGAPVVFVFGRSLHSGFVSSLLIPGRHPVPFEWRAPPGAVPEALTSYAGDYFSAELNSRYRVSVVDSTIVLRAGTSGGITARPVFTDTFVSGQLTIEFVRDRGDVTGFRISHPRARGLRFTRVQPSRSSEAR